jgi:carboxylesterase
MSAVDHSYKVRGGRTGVLLIHGLCGTPAEMRYVANGLARAGYTVSCPQLHGHCGTEADLKACTWQEWYRSVEMALDDLRETCDTVIVGGLSTGALLGLMLAARRPADVQGCLCLAPTLWLNGWNIPWIARLFRIVRHKAFANMIPFPDIHPHGIKDPRVREFVLNAMMGGNSAMAGLPSTPGGAVLEHRWLVEALMPMIPGITQATLILHPREDDYADLCNATYLQRKLGGSVETVVLDDSYHVITLDRQRHVVVDRTSGFVERVARQSNLARGQRQRAPAAMVA